MKDYKEKNYVNMYPLPAKGRGRDYVKVQEMYDDIKKNPADFYAQAFLNDRSCFLNEEKRKRVTSNWIAEQLLDDKLLEKIEKVYSPRPYLVGHPTKVDDTPLRENDDREEEKVAHRLYEREYDSNSDIDFFVDYQVPILRKKDSKKDKEASNYVKTRKPGKVDLVAVSEAKKEIYLMELKKHHAKNNQDETLLRCVCECYTYWKQICHKKLAKEISLNSKHKKAEYADYKVVPAVLVFEGQYQHLQLRSGYLHSLQELMIKYGVKMFVIDCDMEFKSDKSYEDYINKCIIKELPVQVIDFPALAKRKSQELAIALDDAIHHAEHKADKNIYGGYTFADKFYSTYLSNKTFDKFLAEMKPEFKEMFKDGDGGELEVRCDKDGKAVYPPKMACFGSSSRMMYNAAKHLSNFIFEKKMPTTVGGTANLDGYYNAPECHIFVEAKCREPYGEKSNIISRKYEELYKHISDSPKTNITCDIGSVQDEKKMKVIFKYDDKVISYFDIKQLISHYLGIATAILKEEKNEQDVKYFYKPIKFLYFIYDPRELYFEYPLLGERIKEIFGITCDECESINHQGLFEIILEYLKDNYYTDSSVDINKIANGFRLSICSQNNFNYKLEYTDADGKKKSKLKRGFATRKDAEYYEEQFIKSAGKEREYQFEEVVKFYLEQRGHKSKLSTMTTKESIINNYILPEFKGKDIREIHKRDLMRWQSKYLFAKDENGERKLKDTYIKTINCQLRAIFNFAKMSDFIEYNPVTDLEAVGKKNSDRKYIVWSADDMKLFLNCITDYEDAYLAFNILLYTGIRKGELLALTLKDFSYENKTLNIDKTFSVIKGKEVITTPKTESSTREVPLPSFLCDEIQNYIDLLYEPDDSERIFKYKSGSFLVDAMEVGCKRTGLPKIRIHDTRHSHITMLASLLIPNKEIAERVGQKGNNMVIHYSHSTSIEQKNIVDILEKERGDN